MYITLLCHENYLHCFTSHYRIHNITLMYVYAQAEDDNNDNQAGRDDDNDSDD